MRPRTLLARTLLMVTTALLAGGGALYGSCDQALAAAATPVTVAAADQVAAQTLLDILQKTRVQAGLPALSRQPALDQAAAAHALALANGTVVPDLRQGLVHALYIPMQDIVLEARASGDAGQPLSIWQGTASTSGAMATPGMSDVGLARVANPATTGPNDAYIWVVVLAQPLRAPAESPDSPRWTPR